MVNKCELSANRRQLQQAKDADRLEPKGTWSVQGLKLSLSWTYGHRRLERTFPTLANKRDKISPHRSQREDESQGKPNAVPEEAERTNECRSGKEREGVEPTAPQVRPDQS